MKVNKKKITIIVISFLAVILLFISAVSVFNRFSSGDGAIDKIVGDIVGDTDAENEATLTANPFDENGNLFIDFEEVNMDTETEDFTLESIDGKGYIRGNGAINIPLSADTYPDGSIKPLNLDDYDYIIVSFDRYLYFPETASSEEQYIGGTLTGYLDLFGEGVCPSKGWATSELYYRYDYWYKFSRNYFFDDTLEYYPNGYSGNNPDYDSWVEHWYLIIQVDHFDVNASIYGVGGGPTVKVYSGSESLYYLGLQFSGNIYIDNLSCKLYKQGYSDYTEEELAIISKLDTFMTE